MFNFTVSYDELVKVLGFSNTVLSDKSVEEKAKNVIFHVKDGEVKVIGRSPFTFSRTILETFSAESDSEVIFQVKASNLNKILQSYASLYKTKVSDLEFSDEANKIVLKVHEEAINPEDSKLSNDSVYRLDNIPVVANVQSEITMEFPEETELLDSAELYLYIDALVPLMSNESASTNASKLNFAEDYVFVITGYMSSFFKNKLPDAFKDITLSYSSVNFLKKLTSDVENVSVCKTDKYVCIQGNNTEAFLRHQKIRIKYKQFIDGMSTNMGIVVDRLYLKDVIKRMSNVSSEGKFFIADGIITANADGFTQEIPLNNVKEGTNDISFNVSLGTLEKAIIGKDDSFTNDLFIYFVQSARGYRVYIKDKTGAWLSNLQCTRA